jgi:hypothetical protein
LIFVVSIVKDAFDEKCSGDPDVRTLASNDANFNLANWSDSSWLGRSNEDRSCEKLSVLASGLSNVASSSRVNLLGGGNEDGSCENPNGLAGGLCNIGETCYMNSVLQCFLRTAAVRRQLDTHQTCQHEAACVLCLLRQTNSVRLLRPATADFMKRWVPFLTQWGFELGTQDSAISLALMLCQQIGSDSNQGSQLGSSLQTQFHRARTTMCKNLACPEVDAASESVEVDQTMVFLLENPKVTDSSLASLLVDSAASKLLNEGLRCEVCSGGNKQGPNTKAVMEQTFIDKFADVMVFGFPRGDVMEAGRQTRNTHGIDFPSTIKLEGTVFSLSAFVEHLPSDGRKADGGHYVAWSADATGWLRYDDANVSREALLPSSVNQNVVLAVYEKVSSNPEEQRRQETGPAP